MNAARGGLVFDGAACFSFSDPAARDWAACHLLITGQPGALSRSLISLRWRNPFRSRGESCYADSRIVEIMESGFCASSLCTVATHVKRKKVKTHKETSGEHPLLTGTRERTEALKSAQMPIEAEVEENKVFSDERSRLCLASRAFSTYQTVFAGEPFGFRSLLQSL